MSRHEFPGKAGATSALLGWDRALDTFFVQIFRPDGNDDEDSRLIWFGTAPGELATAASAIAVARPYADLPGDIATRLETDRLKTLGTSDGEQQIAAKRRLFGP